MSNTHTIPTNKYGQPYYGPRTMAEVEQVADQIWEDTGSESCTEEFRKLAQSLEDNGFTGLAARFRKVYDLEVAQ